ncbi:Tim44/TimA family putative adaptor protein [Paracoccus sp. 1_MG-2023]|uniref:Tim44/TimA family putative adaptor protein n=1 Tax=unclassified Paracoccus (in: a-proteobacteria) TaxID=2688777 RepID=UPI001C07F16D|nr:MULTISPECIES: Tim44/TimA family putative adaptor protein [unclassified Paracoccus (in: a-proteobacteria)]MBU2957197.1 Tim44/TimA family putative adaptor protein [Paracoccus sp. C2R09]MDO6669084.1 Tim44/TimA family putative adaptor protein [Paracoccus sp. 1_MG-2023]
MSNPILQLLVLAGIAIFLILRLKNVLGTRDGFEPPKVEDPAPTTTPARFEVIDGTGGEQDHDILDHVDAGSPAAAALAEMKRIEPDFAVGEFLGGARQAYEMILMAFENGDITDVRPFLAPPVADAFQSVIDQRAAAGQTVEAQYLGTRETTLAGAEFDRATGEAEVSVRFLAQLIVATRDAEGNVIDGDPKAARKQKDTWTFARRMGSDDPNWQLVATG